MSKTGAELTTSEMADAAELIGGTAPITGVLMKLSGAVGYPLVKGHHHEWVVLTAEDVGSLSDAAKNEIIALMETKF